MNIYKLFCFICIFVKIFAKSINLQRKEFVILHKWTNLELSFPSEAEREAALHKGFYIPNKAIPVDMDIEYGGVYYSFNSSENIF